MKLIIIGIIGLLLGIPLFFVGLLQSEREGRYIQVRSQVATQTGEAQTMLGPYLEVPYTYPRVEDFVTENGQSVERVQKVTKYLTISAQKLSLIVKQSTSELHKAIYQVSIQKSVIEFTAQFGPFELPQLVEGAEVLWNRAQWIIGITDLRGLTKLSVVNGDKSVDFVTRSKKTGSWHSYSDNLGAATKWTNMPTEPVFLEGELVVQGVEDMMFNAAGETTKVTMSSDWPHPNFSGSHSPSEREISEDGFQATWLISEYARMMPNVWTDSPDYVGFFGVSLSNPVDAYAQVGRSLKYALLFVVIVLAAFWMLETISTTKVHPAQYILVGLAQTVFYLLLLSLVEHIPVELAYLFAGLATTLLTGVYALWTYQRPIFAWGVLLGTAISYIFQYTLVQLEDYALLLGSFLVFILLASLMYISRKIQWYTISKVSGEP